jgi:hypothetical protein
MYTVYCTKKNLATLHRGRFLWFLFPVKTEFFLLVAAARKLGLLAPGPNYVQNKTFQFNCETNKRRRERVDTLTFNKRSYIKISIRQKMETGISNTKRHSVIINPAYTYIFSIPCICIVMIYLKYSNEHVYDKYIIYKTLRFLGCTPLLHSHIFSPPTSVTLSPRKNSTLSRPRYSKPSIDR